MPENHATTGNIAADEVSWDDPILVERFFRGNGVAVNDDERSACEIHFETPKIKGTLQLSLHLTRRECVNLMYGLGLQVVDETAGHHPCISRKID